MSTTASWIIHTFLNNCFSIIFDKYGLILIKFEFYCIFSEKKKKERINALLKAIFSHRF